MASINAKQKPAAVCTAVVGLQWGDEGKGKVVDLIAPKHKAVVRYNGGANAGHSVVIQGKRHAFHLIPSGIFHPGVRAIIGNGVVLDPITLLREMDALSAAGIDVSSLVVSDRAHVVLPYHKQEDALREAVLKDDVSQGDSSIGTTGRGIGPAYAEKVHRAAAIRVGDLLRPDTLRAKVASAARFKRSMFEKLNAESGSIDEAAIVESMLSAGERLRPHITDTVYLLHDLLRRGEPVLFEGANATLLDVDHGTYPFVTSSNTTALGIPSGAGVPTRSLNQIIGVMKAYSTRVGSGPFPTELRDGTGDRIRERGREYGTTTGRPRRCGWLDLVAVRYSVMLNDIDAIALTLLDVLSGFESLRVCTAYDVRGKRTDRFIPDCSDLANARPIFQELPGFAPEIDSVRRRDDLPDAARRYVDLIEEFLEVPVAFIGVGPDRDQTIVNAESLSF